MRKILWTALLITVVAGSFLAGHWSGERRAATSPSGAPRQILYYIDPMHPAYRSDKPGIAPDCGMELVPVYADEAGAGVPVDASSGAVRISTEAQQRIGVRLATVEKARTSTRVRILGRVVAAEDRTYRVTAGAEGWIREVAAGTTTGSQVAKGQLLASLFSADAIVPQLTYLSTVATFDRLPQSAREIPGQWDSTRAVAQRNKATLRSLGMSEAQIEELTRTRIPAEAIQIVAPANGIVLARSVSADQRVEKGSELFRIADLGLVWVLADLFENDAAHLRPGAVVSASVPSSRQAFRAKVAEVLPQFDGTTRTLKVRLEADNPGLVLRPDMFVDLELPVVYPAAIVVPVDAVVDSGLRKILYVEREAGVFEPRPVETGWRHGDQVEIVTGLRPGERIVISGTFLLDSESRMRAGQSSGQRSAVSDQQEPTKSSRQPSAVSRQPEPAGSADSPPGHPGHMADAPPAASR